MRFTIKLALGIVILLAIASVAIPQGDPMVDARARWSPPLDGTPVIGYVLQHSVNDAAWYDYSTSEDTTVVMTLTYYDTHRVRVAGIGLDSLRGAWSEPSNYYSPIDSIPGIPGKPFTKGFIPKPGTGS